MSLSDYPHISTESPDSFARFTFENRLPVIIDNIISAHLFKDDINQQLLRLKGNLLTIKIESFTLEKDEEKYWQFFFDTYSQKKLMEIPFFFAEIYFYRYILHLTRFNVNGLDPFAQVKVNEMNESIALFEKLLSNVKTIREAISVSLTGNKADLSQLNRNESDLEIIVNHTEQLLEQIEKQDTIHIILDNAGVELFGDLLLVTQILQKYPDKVVRLYPKQYPLLVSDATKEDITLLINFLENSGRNALFEFAEGCNAHFESENIEIFIDSFWNSPNHFIQIPDDIKKRIKLNDLVIAKGDANYRRFYEDRMIPVDYVGAAEISKNQFGLRTLKSEIIAGIETGLANQLYQNDPQWMVNGRYAVIQKIL